MFIFCIIVNPLDGVTWNNLVAKGLPTKGLDVEVELYLPEGGGLVTTSSCCGVFCRFWGVKLESGAGDWSEGGIVEASIALVTMEGPDESSGGGIVVGSGMFAFSNKVLIAVAHSGCCHKSHKWQFSVAPTSFHFISTQNGSPVLGS
jgi:hypothetical protein